MATLGRLALFLAIAAGFTAAGWHLLDTAPQSRRERPPVPVPLVDVVDSSARTHAVLLRASGPVVSDEELEIRPQVGGLIEALHPDFEPGGRIPAGAVLLRIDPADYQLAVAAAEAEVDKARAAIALEQGRRVVAREELESLQRSVRVDPSSQELALREPQLRQVRAELAAAQNRLAQARLDLARTELSLPFDVIVLERQRVAGEVAAARELVGRVTRADRLRVELRTSPAFVGRLRAGGEDGPGSPVRVQYQGRVFAGEVVRIRADLAEGSRLAGVIVALPLDPAAQARPLLGSYVEAEIDAGEIGDAVAVPRRALRDNARVWVADADARLAVREARVLWETGQELLLAAASLLPGDRVVVSRVAGLIPGTQVRTRSMDPASGLALPDPAGPRDD
jgi:RND family efflux transporter MFP subunit